MRPLVWFRSDLRVRDNTALYEACEAAADGVIGVFVVCADQWLREHDWSDAKVDLILRGLSKLRDELSSIGVPLKILEVPKFDGVPAAVDTLMAATRCTSLYFNREYEVNEARRDEAVTAEIERAGRTVRAFTDQVVFAPGDVLTKQGGWYTVFTPFKKRWRQRWLDGERPRTLDKPRKQRPVGVESDPVPQGVEGFARDAATIDAGRWPAGEVHASERLAVFIERGIGSYHEDRNFPDIEGTSTLSPYLATGMISPRACLDAAVEANDGRLESGGAGAVGWIDELIWREFYKHVLVAFPRVCMHHAFRRDMDRVPWSRDESAFEAWKSGRTGYPIVDAAMRQLAQTGWMHNRLRMIVAMFLTKHLMIDWRWGERYFMRTLIDGDLAANNGGWQWSASTGTDAQPYFRIFNPTTQGQKFDPMGHFVRRYVPELGGIANKTVHEPHKAGVTNTEARSYPEPIVDHKRARERTLAAFKKAAGKA